MPREDNVRSRHERSRAPGALASLRHFDPRGAGAGGRSPPSAYARAARVGAQAHDRSERRRIVVVRNVGAGHAVPTGATFLQTSVRRRDRRRDDRARSCPRSAMRGDSPVALLTDADHVGIGSQPAPSGACVTASIGRAITARLFGRAISDDVLRALDLEARRAEVPTHTIAIATSASE
jgi:hypothetical protein